MTEQWIASAVAALAGGANISTKTKDALPRPQPIERANRTAKPKMDTRAQPSSGGRTTSETRASRAPRNKKEAATDVPGTIQQAPPPPDSVAPVSARTPSKRRATETELAGQEGFETHSQNASQPSHRAETSSPERDNALHPHGEPLSGGDYDRDNHMTFAPGTLLRARGDAIMAAPATQAAVGQVPYETQSLVADSGTLIPRIVEEYRRRQDMLRARQRLELQAQAICRRYVDGDKIEAAKLWAAVRKDPDHELRVWLNPFLHAIAALDASKKEIEATLTRLSGALPVAPWAETILGLGKLSLAAIVGEAGIAPGEYRSVSALWKRMGLAVINGERQRRVAGKAALAHGYNAERRSLMWNVGGSLMKAQLRSEKDDAGKKIEGSEYSLGELGQVYLDRKAYLREREAAKDEPWSKARIHNNAKRYMEKRLLRLLWAEWRRAIAVAETKPAVPAAELQEAA